jgi:hypothetical protein
MASASRRLYDSARLIDPTAVFPPRDGGDALITGTPSQQRFRNRSGSR